MAARGSIAKAEIQEKILSVFPGAFMEDAKILRIPTVENGEPIEIKITMTAAKDCLGGEVAVSASITQPKERPTETLEPTPEEKQRLETLIKNLF